MAGEDLRHLPGAGDQGVAALAHPPPAEEFFQVLEAGVLFAREGSHNMAVHGVGLPSVGRFVQAPVNQQAPAVVGGRDAVGEVALERVPAADLRPGVGHLGVAVRALHEDDLPARREAPRDAREGFRHGLDRARDHAGHRFLEAARHPAADHAHAGEPDPLHGVAQEVHPRSALLGEHHLDLRPVDLERDAGHPGAAAEVHQRGGQLHQVGGQHGVDVELQDHALEIAHAREVQFDVAFPQAAVVGPELLELHRGEPNAAGSENRLHPLRGGFRMAGAVHGRGVP